MSRAAWLIVGMVSGVVLMQFFGPEPFVEFPEVIVPAARIIELEPPARPPTIVERVVYRFPPVRTARAVGGGTAAVSAFCEPVLTPIQTDTVVVTAGPILMLRSGVYNRSWWGKDNLRLVGPTNMGDLLQLSYHTLGSCDFRTSGDSVIVRYGRFNAVKDYARMASDMWALYSIFAFAIKVIK